MVLSDECGQVGACGPATRAYVAGADLALLDQDVGVERDPEQVVGRVPGHDAALAPVVGQPDLVHHLVLHPQRHEPVGHQHPCLDGSASGDDGGPPSVVQTALGSKLRGHLHEHLRLQLGKPVDVAAHRAGGVVLGQPARGEDEREDVCVQLRRAGVHAVPGPDVLLADRVALLAVDRVAERRLDGLVVRGHRAVEEPRWHVERPLPVALHDERVHAGDAGNPVVVRTGAVGRRLRLLEVRYVVPGPLSCLAGIRVPPDVGLALAPRLAVRVGGGPVVEHPPVGWPGPSPLRRDPGLLGPGLAPGSLVDAVLVDAGVDPASTERRTVRLHLAERGQRAPGGDVVAVDLLQHVERARFSVLTVGGVVPGEVEDRPVALVGRPGQPFADHEAEVVEEPQLGAAVPRWLDRLLAPLQHPLGLGEGALLLHVGGGRHQEDLGGALLRHDLAGGHLGGVLPEGRALDLEEVAHDEPVEVGHAEALRLAVR